LPRRRHAVRSLWVALSLSGFAALVNQVAWQRALKVFLGGSETLSALLVIVVFMAGLGGGSLLAAAFAPRLRSPLGALARVEVALAVTTLVIGSALAFDLHASIFAIQRAAMAFGLPLRLLYGLGAAVVIGLPCLLMGTTVALASEGLQRQMARDDARDVARLVAANTAGAIAGAAATVLYLMPYHGQRVALLVASLANLAAGLGVAVVARTIGSSARRNDDGPAAQHWTGPLTTFEWTGAIVGALAMGYEMALLRQATLAHGPLPETFGLVMTAYLFCWSAGVWMSTHLRDAVLTVLVVTAALVASIPAAVGATPGIWIARGALVAALAPCVGFGLIYGWVAARASRQWGRDMGRFTALNTLGSCAGILLFTLAGYEMSPFAGGLVLACGLMLAAMLWGAHQTRNRVRWRVSSAGVALCLAASVVAGLRMPVSETPDGRVFYGRDGVIEIRGRNIIWDGLWHSALSDGADHVGGHNWLHAVAPLVAHDGRVHDVLVIGLGAGITAATLAGVDQVEAVDVYEINRTLTQVLDAYPEGTLHVGTNPRVRILWRDGRTGLALNQKTYDLITQQPLYLKQAGSSTLLSREYLQLARSRLKPRGIMAVYANSAGNEEEGLLVRQTVHSVFPYCESFEHGYLILASESPIDLSPEKIRERLKLYPAINSRWTRWNSSAARPNPSACPGSTMPIGWRGLDRPM